MCFTMEDAKHVVEIIDALLTGMYALVLQGIFFFPGDLLETPATII